MVRSSITLATYQGDPDGNLRCMKSKRPFHPTLPYILIRYRAASRTLGGIPSPSDYVKTSSAVKETFVNPSGPRYGRPSDLYGPHITLFDHARPFYSMTLTISKRLRHLSPPYSGRLCHRFPLCWLFRRGCKGVDFTTHFRRLPLRMQRLVA